MLENFAPHSKRSHTNCLCTVEIERMSNGVLPRLSTLLMFALAVNNSFTYVCKKTLVNCVSKCCKPSSCKQSRLSNTIWNGVLPLHVLTFGFALQSRNKYRRNPIRESFVMFCDTFLNNTHTSCRTVHLTESASFTLCTLN